MSSVVGTDLGVDGACGVEAPLPEVPLVAGPEDGAFAVLPLEVGAAARTGADGEAPEGGEAGVEDGAEKLGAAGATGAARFDATPPPLELGELAVDPELPPKFGLEITPPAEGFEAATGAETAATFVAGAKNWVEACGTALDPPTLPGVEKPATRGAAAKSEKFSRELLSDALEVEGILDSSRPLAAFETSSPLAGATSETGFGGTTGAAFGAGWMVGRAGLTPCVKVRWG